MNRFFAIRTAQEHDSGIFLYAEGELAEQELWNSPAVEDSLLPPIPAPGFWVWEGTAGYSHLHSACGEHADCEPCFKGAWRRARIPESLAAARGDNPLHLDRVGNLKRVVMQLEEDAAEFLEIVKVMLDDAKRQFAAGVVPLRTRRRV